MSKLSDHLKERHLNVDLYDGVYLNEEERLVTFLLWNLSGKLVGYLRYRPDGVKKGYTDSSERRYLPVVGGDTRNRHLAVWGLESLSWRSDILVVCEGIFDACRFHNLGIPAVALLSSNDSRYKDWLECLDRNLYAALDDHATQFTGMTDLQLPEGKADFGECTDQQIEETVRNFMKVGEAK